jgi:hypothetical protein
MPPSAQSCRIADVRALRRTGLIREFAATPRIDVVLHRMCGPAQRHPTGLAINKERTSTCIKVLDCRASLCRSLIHPGDDPSPVALIHGGHDPNIVAGRHPRGQVLLRQLSRLGGVQVPRHTRTVTPPCAPGEHALICRTEFVSVCDWLDQQAGGLRGSDTLGLRWRNSAGRTQAHARSNRQPTRIGDRLGRSFLPDARLRGSSCPIDTLRVKRCAQPIPIQMPGELDHLASITRPSRDVRFCRPRRGR